jgi:hypothetical protein
MGSTAARTVGKAVVKRITGIGPNVVQSIAAATIVGAGAGVLTYRLLRSGD